MSRANQGETLVPRAEPSLDRLKYEVAQELGLMSGNENPEPAYDQALDRWKYEVADELGLADRIKQVGWGNMTTRECGKIGGRMGGHIGGQMVKRMIQFAESHMR